MFAKLSVVFAGACCIGLAQDPVDCFVFSPAGATSGSTRQFYVTNNCVKTVTGLAYEMTVQRTDGTRPKQVVATDFRRVGAWRVAER